MRLVYFFLIALLPLTAHADPVFTPIALYLGVSVTTVSIAAQIAFAVGTRLYGAAQQRRAAQKAKDDYNASLSDRTVTAVTADSPFRTVYGTARVGSAIVAIFTSGDKDQFKHLVCIHAAHECNAILDVYVASKALGPLDGNGWVTSGDYFASRTEQHSQVSFGSSLVLDYEPSGQITLVLKGDYVGAGESGTDTQIDFIRSGSTISFANPAGGQVIASYTYTTGTPRVRVRKHLGGAADPVDAQLVADSGGAWDSNAVLRGFCYTVITLDINQAEFAGGVPAIEVLVQGKKLYDFRTGATAFSDNNALVIYDYLVGEICNIDVDDLPLADFIAAANVCSQDRGDGQPLYTFDGTVTADESPASVLEKMAQSMAGGIVSTTWGIWAGAYTGPVMALNQADIVGSFSLTPGASDSDKFNGIKGQFISAENAYVATDFLPYQNAAYLAADGEERWNSIDFPYSDGYWRVFHIAQIFTEDARNGYTIKATFSLKTWALKVGQRVTMTSPLFGWQAKIFRVTDKSYSPTSMVELTLKEDAASIWDQADEPQVDATINTTLPNPFYVAPLAYLNAPLSGTNVLLMQSDGSIVSRILVSWAASNQANTEIVVEWTLLGQDNWQRLSVAGDETQAYISPVSDGSFYNIRAKVTRPSLSTESDWVYAVHQVVGKTELPPNVQSPVFVDPVVSWDSVSAPDLAGYVLRYNLLQSLDWDHSTALHDGIVTSTSFNLPPIFGGDITVLIRAIDTTGNVSAMPAVVYGSLIPPSVETFSITNGVLSWPPVVAADLRGYVLRFQYGENRVWSNASNLHDGVVTQSPFKPELIPPGVCTLMIKAVDMSGNESLNAAVIVANLGDVIVENLILTYDDQAAGFPGTKTNGTVSNGTLVANDTGGKYWLDNDAPHFGRVAENYWALVSYGAMEYVTQYVTHAEQAGSRLTLSAIVGTDGSTFWAADAATFYGSDTLGFWVAPISYSIEFRYGTQGVFWGADTAKFWLNEDGDLVWQTPTAWQVWPGAIENIGEAAIDFRITTQAGIRPGIIYDLVLNFDVPDQNEDINDIFVPASGLRLPTKLAWRAINNVQLQ
ncbi:MAG: hypothetical protein ACRYF5_06840, partial [Janthinobacterium lividum]